MVTAAGKWICNGSLSDRAMSENRGLSMTDEHVMCLKSVIRSSVDAWQGGS